MKQMFILLVAVPFLMGATAGLAFADGGPHGGYTATTDGCAGCHRTHTASGPNLVVDSNTYSLCMSCHGSAGAGANTNVDDGYYLASRDNSGGNDDHGALNTPDNAPLLGGGFVNYLGVAVTSTHDPTGSTGLAWGYGTALRGGTAAMADGSLSCASCHDPHGSGNYRIINETINGATVAVAQVDEGPAKDYDTEQWGAGMSSACAACHESYHRTNPDQANIVDGGSYTHRVDMPYQFGGNANPETIGFGGYTLPLAQSGSGDIVVCATCHVAHGTSAAMSGLGQDPYTNDSALLRLDNRGVCEVCHQK